MFGLVRITLDFFSGQPKFLLIPEVRPSPNIKKLFLRLPEREDELLSTIKIITFLAASLSKLHQLALSNVIPYPL